MEIKEFNEEIEQLFIQFMYSDPETFTRIKNITSPTYFDDHDYRKVVKLLMEYTDDHPAMPTQEQIKAIAGVTVEPISDIDEEHTKWFLNNYEIFCKQRAAREAVHKSIDLIKENRLGEVVEALKAASELGIVRDLGLNYFEDPSARLERIRDKKNMISTCWKHVDEKLYGGFNRGELTIFAGQSGAGKSLFLQNLALNWATAGLNVVYISLELSEELCSMRIDSMTTGYATREIMKNISDVALKVGMYHKTCHGPNGMGTLQIKQLRSGATATDIRAYIKEYEIQTKRKVDAILVDYLDLCHPVSVKVAPSDMFVKDKYVSEELRNVAVDLNCLMVTASQLNRGSHDEIEFDHSHIAGGISKINTADNVIAIFTTISMKESGRYQVQFLKTRSSAGVGSKVDLKYDPRTLRISDLADDELDAMTSTTQSILSQIGQKNVVTPTEKKETAPEEKKTLKNGLALRDLVKRTSSVTPKPTPPPSTTLKEGEDVRKEKKDQ